MTKTRQEATIRKIERGIEKLLPKPDDEEFAIGGYDDEMGDDIRDLESDSGGEGDENQADENVEEENQDKENRDKENGGEENRGEENQSEENQFEAR